MKARVYPMPASAFRLLVYLHDLQAPLVSPGGAYTERTVIVPSLAKLARVMSTESKYIRRHLQWLEDQGYLERVSFSVDGRRAAEIKLRRLRNV